MLVELGIRLALSVRRLFRMYVGGCAGGAFEPRWTSVWRRRGLIGASKRNRRRRLSLSFGRR
eukprot:3513450-Pleurochrysis_carterae.AAC.3